MELAVYALVITGRVASSLLSPGPFATHVLRGQCGEELRLPTTVKRRSVDVGPPAAVKPSADCALTDIATEISSEILS